jgi:hypothetical protein
MGSSLRYAPVFVAKNKPDFIGLALRRNRLGLGGSYWPIELATEENTLFELPPINRMVPTTNTRITASMTAYSAMSWPWSSFHRLRNALIFIPSPF